MSPENSYQIILTYHFGFYFTLIVQTVTIIYYSGVSAHIQKHFKEIVRSKFNPWSKSP